MKKMLTAVAVLLATEHIDDGEFVGDALERERDAHAVGRRRAKVVVKNHKMMEKINLKGIKWKFAVT